MQRRAFLRAGGAAGAVLAVSGAAVGTSTATPRASQEVPDSFEPLGQLELPDSDPAEVVIDDHGETAYLATTYGFATVDLGDPTAPELLAERTRLEADGQEFTRIFDVKVDGDRLAVVGPADEGFGEFNGFELYDVSDPADPAVVDRYETGFHIHNCFFADELLYVVNNGPDDTALVIYDTSDDDTEAVGRWSLLDHDPEWEDVYWYVHYLHDVTVHGDLAVFPFWDAGTYLVDVSDPSDPKYVSHVRDPDVSRDRSYGEREAVYGLPGNDHYATVDDAGELLAVGREAWTTGGSAPDGPGGIDLYDVTDPSAPEPLASIEPPESDDASRRGGEWTTAHNFELRDGRLYSAWYQGGIKIHDVSDPAAPEGLAHWRATDDAALWTARVANDGATVVASSTSRLPATDIDGALYTFPTGLESDGFETGGDDNGSDGDGNDSLSDRVPGFGGLSTGIGLAGSAAALEWVRRRGDDR
ncbi:LVIVD repeat protein [Haloterrigena turkmenica DSM 5511]|uniref:LVIVD repeat protein n=1 Tax=Haloterrigena turkmenica (strain ATCC 51198 / DSM 5511 / JCM 9101 / NCIMB 13204 / VKM B-1734 / 4k) TaxID=543526 RepID=D2RYW5_HALTV|nr:hypothetical protein [Haloterrigena turkmenica]ADB61933.1 LVIVD repeat protein [Haloterrigena turkmenica DSM 5511]